jgi:hypothetical protein
MQRSRFEAILRCVHLVNNEELVTDQGAPGYDKLAKVRWLIEEFARISQALYNAKRICTIDEIMIPYKGRYCAIRQYMKSKPVRFGIKLWALGSNQSRYASCFFRFSLFFFRFSCCHCMFVAFMRRWCCCVHVGQPWQSAYSGSFHQCR